MDTNQDEVEQRETLDNWMPAHCRGQTTVENCIGGHVNVLSDYKKTLPSKIRKIFHSNCYHLIDTLTKFYQNHIPPALLKRPDVRCL